MVWRTLPIPRYYRSFTLYLKIVELTVEVSQTYTFQKLLKIAYEDSSLRKIKMASI